MTDQAQPPLAAEAREATFAAWYQAHAQQAGWAAGGEYDEEPCAAAILEAVDAAVEIVAKLAERLAATVPVQGGTMPFADIIRHQQRKGGGT